MRHRYLITVTDYKGARHFTLTQLMRRTLAGIVGSLLVVFLAGTVGIHTLSGKVSRLNAEVGELSALHERLQADNQALLADREALQVAVEEKAHSLMALGDELENIEIMIGLRAEPELPLTQRIDTASQTAFEKRLMLESIPSGFPVESGQVTSSFGMRRHPIEERMAMHGGADLRAPTGPRFTPPPTAWSSGHPSITTAVSATWSSWSTITGFPPCTGTWTGSKRRSESTFSAAICWAIPATPEPRPRPTCTTRSATSIADWTRIRSCAGRWRITMYCLPTRNAWNGNH